jgi:long-chain acyl-CoA synthetase
MLVNEFLEKSASLYPGKTALICHDSRLTFAEIDRATNSLGRALINQGMKKQDRVIIYLDNSVASVVSLFGILKAGGVFIVIDPQVKAKKLNYILEDCQARNLITDTAHLAGISEILSSLKSLKQVILTDDEYSEIKAKPPGSVSEILHLNSIVTESPPMHLESSCIDTDLASLIYTSGSSGNPKGVMLTHHNMVSAATSIIQYLENTADDIILNSLPLAFDYGLYQILMAFKFGGTVVLEKAFVYPQEMIKLINRENVTGWPIVPMIAAILSRFKNLDKQGFPSLRYITSTGQALPPKHIDFLKRAFPNVKIYSMYGLTECKRVSYLPPEQLEKRQDSVGKAIPNTEVYIVGKNDEVITEAGRPGELVVRGSNVMKGYWNLPKETAKALRPGPFPGEKVLYTGDLFQQDEEGYLYFLGRKDDIIKTSGYMVSPKEVENVLSAKDDVIEAAVIGVDDDIMGNVVQAFVHVADDSQSTAEDIMKFCSERLENFAVPKKVILCGALPRTVTGKINKRELLTREI